MCIRDRDRAYDGGVELKNAIVNKTGKTVHDYMYVRADKMIQAMHYGRNNEFMDNVIKLSNMFELPMICRLMFEIPSVPDLLLLFQVT